VEQLNDQPDAKHRLCKEAESVYPILLNKFHAV
jgi:hypothetical protein